MYLSPWEMSMKDIAVDQRASLTMSLAQVVKLRSNSFLLFDVEIFRVPTVTRTTLTPKVPSVPT